MGLSNLVWFWDWFFFFYIFITKNGKVVAKISKPYQDRVDMVKSLFGILPADITLEEAKTERLNQI